MHLQRVRDALHRDLKRQVTAERFAAATRSEPALSAFGTPEDALALLHDTHASTVARNDVVVGLLQVVQRGRAPELLSLLIVAFSPGLIGVRRSLARARDSSLDMLVLEAFVEAVHTFPLQTQARTATMGLVFATRRAAHGELRRLRSERRCDPVPVDEHRELAAATVTPEGALLCREVEGEVTLAALEELLREVGLLRDGSSAWLSAGVDRQRGLAGKLASQDARREHWRAQRARNRVLRGAQLQNVRERLSANREHLPLLLQEGWQ